MRSFRRRTWRRHCVLQKNGCDVWIPRKQVCCGALHYHSALDEPAKAFARQNCQTFLHDAGNIDAIIVNAAGCGAMLKDYGHLFHGAPEAEIAATFAKKVKDISEFLIELGPIKPTHPLKLKAAYHDACHLCHGQQIRKQPRQLLELIPELQLVPLNESEICCGAAGSYNLTQPEMAERLGRTQGEEPARHRRGRRLYRQRRLPDSDWPISARQEAGRRDRASDRCLVGELWRGEVVRLCFLIGKVVRADHY